MADLVGKGELGHFRGHPAVVVDKGDDARVEALVAAAVVLE